MLHEALRIYLESVENSINALHETAIERYEEEILTPERINLRIRIRFQNGYLLELNEALIIKNREIASLSYRYHFQDTNAQIIFRYDDTPHFPNLKSFPHHKHLRETVLDSIKPAIIQVIQEAKELVGFS